MIKRVSLNISEVHKCFLWLPAKTSTTHATHVLNHFDFYSIDCDYTKQIVYQKRDYISHNHVQELFLGHERYDLISTTRNPYSRVVSMFEYFRPQDKEGKKFETFEEFVYQYKKLPVKPYFTQRVPDYFIRQENLYEDYIKIPFVRDSKLNTCGILEELCGRKMNESSPKLKTYKEYYNQELADIIYLNYKEYFDHLNYDKDSWK